MAESIFSADGRTVGKIWASFCREPSAAKGVGEKLNRYIRFFVATKSGGCLPYRTLQKCNILRVFFSYFRSALI